MNTHCRTDMNAGRYHVIAALTHIDVVVGMHLGAELLGGQSGDDLVRIHVGTGAGAGLEDIDGKMLVVRPVRDFERRLLNGDRFIGGQQTELGIGPGSSPFD